MYQWLYLWFFSGKNVLPYVLVVPSGNLLRSWQQGYFRSGPLQFSMGTDSSLNLTCCESVNIGSPVGCKIYKFEDWNDINFFQKIIKIFKNFINASNQKYLRLKNDLKLFLSSINSFFLILRPSVVLFHGVNIQKMFLTKLVTSVWFDKKN